MPNRYSTGQLCRHCHQHPAHRAWGLCCVCYGDLPTRQRYSGETVRNISAEMTEARRRLPTRQPGEPEHRCTWCGHYRVDRPLALCTSCQIEYRERAAGMPSEGESREVVKDAG